MYDKLNKTEKRIVAAWKSSDINDAYDGLYSSGWANDLSVVSGIGPTYQNMPKVHPAVIDLLAELSQKIAAVGKVYSEEQVTALTEFRQALFVGKMPLDSRMQPRVTTTERHGLSQVFFHMADGTHVRFVSPVNLVCWRGLSHNLSVTGGSWPIWEVALMYGAKPVVRVNNG